MANIMIEKVRFEAVSEWFTGKAADKARWACDQINASLEEGEWLPGVSRTVKAALGKVSAKTVQLAETAYKIGRALPYCSEEHPDLNEPGAVPGLRIAYCHAFELLRYGIQDDEELKLIEEHARKAAPEQRADILEVLSAAKRAAAGRAPIVAAVRFLDAQRPKPVFVLKTLSPAGARLLLEAGYKPDSARLPKFEYLRDADGRPYMRIVWPDGTKHCANRFAKVGCSRSGNAQCHACGHAIKSAYNWVPLTLTHESGELHSFWVGRDCAKKLFGVEMKGEAVYESAQGQ